jgi:hypothetical protein
MSNSLITPSIIAKESLRLLKNKLVMAKLVHTDYTKEFKKVGNTVDIRKPVKFVASDGATRVNQDVAEGTVPVSINSQKHVSWKFSSNELTLTVDQYRDRYLNSAMAALAQKVDSSLTGLYSSVPGLVGTPGTTPSTFLELGAVHQKLVEHAAPVEEDLNAVLNPAAALKIANDLKTLFVQQKTVTALEKVSIGPYGGFNNTYRSNSIVTHKVGAYGGTPLVQGASQNSNTTPQANSQTLNTDGWTASITGVLKAGDVITIAGVNDVNPMTYADLGYLKQFVVLADADSGASTGPAALTIAPAIVTSGPYQNVTAGPADNAAITVVTGTASTGYAQNLCFHKNAFALVWAPLEMPDGAAFKSMETDPDTGMSVRVVKQYDIDNDEDIIRLDILFGVKTIYADLAQRLTG